MKYFTIVPASNVPNKLGVRWPKLELEKLSKLAVNKPVLVSNRDHEAESVKNVVGTIKSGKVVKINNENLSDIDRMSIRNDGGFYELQLEVLIDDVETENKLSNGIWQNSSLGFLFKNYTSPNGNIINESYLDKKHPWIEYNDVREVLELSLVYVPSQRFVRVIEAVAA